MARKYTVKLPEELAVRFEAAVAGGSFNAYLKDLVEKALEKPKRLPPMLPPKPKKISTPPKLESWRAPKETRYPLNEPIESNYADLFE